MRKQFVLCALVLSAATAWAGDFDRALNGMQCVDGQTGNIETPSTAVVPHRQWSFGLHRFRAGIDYGLLPNFEAGVSFDLEGLGPPFSLSGKNPRRQGKEPALHSKYRLLRSREHPFDLSVGQHGSRLYMVAAAPPELLWGAVFESGLAWDNNTFYSFFALKRSESMQQYVIDYNPIDDRLNLGLRFLVSSEIRIDFFLTDIKRIENILLDNFMFGVTVAG